MSPEISQITPRGAARAYLIARRSPSLDEATLLKLAHVLATCMSDDEADRFFGLVSDTGSDDTGSDDFVSDRPSTLRPFSGAQDRAAPWDRIKIEGVPLPPKARGRGWERTARRHPGLARIKFES